MKRYIYQRPEGLGEDTTREEFTQYAAVIVAAALAQKIDIPLLIESGGARERVAVAAIGVANALADYLCDPEMEYEEKNKNNN